jgi:hypothetical protein
MEEKGREGKREGKNRRIIKIKIKEWLFVLGISFLKSPFTVFPMRTISGCINRLVGFPFLTRQGFHSFD